MKSRPDQAVCEFGAGVIGRYTNALRQEIPGVRLGKDIEAIHRMRVASRRLRSALPLFESCYAQKYRQSWQKEIRQVTRALGEARDSDVQIDRLKVFLASIQDIALRPGVRRLILRLSQRRAGLQANVIRALDELEHDRTLDSLEEQARAKFSEHSPGEPYSYPLYLLSKQAILVCLEGFLKYEPFISDPASIAELHAMRIAAKQLRYTLEIFSPIYPGELKNPIQIVRSAQEMLGDIHDCDVWAIFLPQFLEKERSRIVRFYGHAGTYKMLIPGITYFQQNRSQFRDQVYRNYLKNWEKWKKKDEWNALLRTIDQPIKLISGQEFYPAAVIPAQIETSESSSGD